jgi:hypothetical protein
VTENESTAGIVTVPEKNTGRTTGNRPGKPLHGHTSDCRTAGKTTENALR